MPYNDRIEVVTPEGVTIDFELAGAGSRFLAAFCDIILQAAFFLAFLLLGMAVGVGSRGFGLAVLSSGGFISVFGYHAIFELLMAGQTPGKKAVGIQVRMSGGSGVTPLAAILRNLVRIADFLPSFYAIGLVSLLTSQKNQRLGDLAAGTIVVRTDSKKRATRQWNPVLGSVSTMGWDISQVTAAEMSTVREFLGRVESLRRESAEGLASRLAGTLRAKVGAANPPADDLAFLKQLDAEYRARGTD